jgi:TonB family protein
MHDPGVDFLKVQKLNDVGLWASLKANIRDAFFTPRQAPLKLTSRPLTRGEMQAGSHETVNLASVQDINDRPLFARLAEGVRAAIFSPKLPPLHLTSRPVKVRDMWGEYNYSRPGATWSTAVHVLMIGALLAVSWAGWKTKKAIVQQQPQQEIALVAPSPDEYMPISKKKNDQLSGGGGGGDRDKLQAPKGKLPKFAMQQLTPPAVVIRNDHPKLTAEPTVVMPPEVKLPLAANMPNLGDPLSKLPAGPPSNGTGSGGGIGSGHGGGVGSGEGGGVGPGMGGGYGGGVFKVGGGVSAPKVIDAPDPDYSEEARKAKYQGTCILWLIVGPDGHPRDLKVARTLGMGLDQKAIEAVRRWRFEPAKMNGKPVAVQINVEVNFRLY